MKADEHPDNMTSLDAPKELIRDLKALYDPSIEISDEIDRSVAAAAWSHFAGKRRRFPGYIRWVGAAAAAMLVTLLLVKPEPGDLLDEADRIALTIAGDFDGSGQVDILDAFALAREFKEGERVGEQWDLNGDGCVDDLDVRRVGMLAVAIH